MKKQTKKRNARLGALVLCTILGGCEFAAPLIAAELDGDGSEVDRSSAELSVQVDSAEGMLNGEALAADTLVVNGSRFGNQLHFSVELDSAPSVVQVMVPHADGSSVDPYLGEIEDSELPPPPMDELEGLPGLASRAEAELLLCDQTDCLVAEDFDLQIEQTEDGRVASFEGSWPGAQSARVVLRYHEVP